LLRQIPTNKFAVLLNLFVGDVAERIEKYSSGSFVCLGGFGKCALKVAGACQGKTAGGLTAASIGADNIAEQAADPLDAVTTPLRDL
jgi:hypothetical protein